MKHFFTHNGARATHPRWGLTAVTWKPTLFFPSPDHTEDRRVKSQLHAGFSCQDPSANSLFCGSKMADLQWETKALKWIEMSKTQIKLHCLNYRWTHSETAECAGDVFLKGNPGVSEREGSVPLTHTYSIFRRDCALQLSQSEQHGLKGPQAASVLP